MNDDWAIVEVTAWRRIEYMVVRPRAGGGWRKVCVCHNEFEAKTIVEAVNLTHETP